MAPVAPEISIVLPAHNECADVVAMIVALKRVVAPLGRAEIVYVDDGSSDGTLAVLRAAAAADPAVRFVSFIRNFGQQAALRAGLRHARGRAVVLMDADFEHPPELIPKLAAAWRAGAKIVATRRSDDEAALSPMKRISSRLFYRLLDMIGDAPMPADRIQDRADGRLELTSGGDLTGNGVENIQAPDLDPGIVEHDGHHADAEQQRQTLRDRLAELQAEMRDVEQQLSRADQAVLDTAMRRLEAEHAADLSRDAVARAEQDLAALTKR